MLVSVNSVEITNQEIRINATNLEQILLSDNLFDQVDEDEQLVNFVFDPENFGHKKYLFKICQSQKNCKNQKSLGEMIEKLPTCILSLSEGFIER